VRLQTDLELPLEDVVVDAIVLRQLRAVDRRQIREYRDRRLVTALQVRQCGGRQQVVMLMPVDRRGKERVLMNPRLPHPIEKGMETGRFVLGEEREGEQSDGGGENRDLSFHGQSLVQRRAAG